MKHIAIIGGGAAGLCAAISAAFQARACKVPVQIDVFEAHAKLGHSILATGNGRCNISHEAFLSADEKRALHACSDAAPWDCATWDCATWTASRSAYGACERGIQSACNVQDAQDAQATPPAHEAHHAHDLQDAPDVLHVPAHDPQAAQATALSLSPDQHSDSSNPLDNPLQHFHNSDFVKTVLEYVQQGAMHGDIACIPQAHAQSYDAALAFFSHLGVAFRCDDQGWLFPYSNTAKTVRELLIHTAQRLGVILHASTEVCALVPSAPESAPASASGEQPAPAPSASASPAPSGVAAFTLTTSEGAHFPADAVIAAWGGKHARTSFSMLARSVKTVPCSPVLGPLICTYPNLKKLDTIRLRAQVSIERTQGNASRIIASEQGEVLFRSYGVSGIAVFNVSRFVHAGDVVCINALNMPIAAATDFLKHKLDQAKLLNAQAAWRDVLYGILPAPFVDVLCEQAISKNDAPDCVARALCQMRLPIEGIKADQCLVSRGGIALEQLDPASLRVTNVPALYAVGEALDVDASCGGFNLHWAWSSGILAGACAVRAWCGAS